MNCDYLPLCTTTTIYRTAGIASIALTFSFFLCAGYLWTPGTRFTNRGSNKNMSNTFFKPLKCIDLLLKTAIKNVLHLSNKEQRTQKTWQHIWDFLFYIYNIEMWLSRNSLLSAPTSLALSWIIQRTFYRWEWAHPHTPTVLHQRWQRRSKITDHI